MSNTQRVEGHTPTPYTLLGGTRIWLTGADERSVGAIHRPADADFIVHACNNIERLEKVNEELVRALDQIQNMAAMLHNGEGIRQTALAATRLAKKPA